MTWKQRIIDKMTQARKVDDPNMEDPIEDVGDFAVHLISACIRSIVAVCDRRPEHVGYPDYVNTTFQHDGIEFLVSITLNPMAEEEAS